MLILGDLGLHNTITSPQSPELILLNAFQILESSDLSVIFWFCSDKTYEEVKKKNENPSL